MRGFLSLATACSKDCAIAFIIVALLSGSRYSVLGIGTKKSECIS
jgi:uncharacterized protein (UPF0179 family)